MSTILWTTFFIFLYFVDFVDDQCYNYLKVGVYMELVASFQDRLREAMGDISVTELADMLGISKQSVSAYINGKRKPKRIVIAEIARVLHVNPVWLSGYNVEKSPSVLDQHGSISLSDTEISLVNDFRKLNCTGREYILQTMAMAVLTYSEKSNTISDVETAK